MEGNIKEISVRKNEEISETEWIETLEKKSQEIVKRSKGNMKMS